MTGPKEGPFGEYEQVEERKFYPAPNLDPVPLEPGELPSSYGKNRLVLLPVDPYLVYTYWELAAGSTPTAGARAVLRFHESPASSTAEASRSFDVDIDLGAGNSYVNLWSPEKVYVADLGLRGEDGSFILLARSNKVSTPPALPVPRTAVPSQRAHLAPPTQEPIPEPIPDPAPDPVPEPDPDPQPVTEPPKFDAAAHLKRKLEELFAIRGELPPMPVPYYGETDGNLSMPTEFQDPLPFCDGVQLPFDLADLEEMDLTQYSEERFTPGISSDGGPLGE